MKNIAKKLRLIYFPFILINVSFCVFYSVLNWLLFRSASTNHVREDLINFWLPFGLAIIPVLVWIRPAIKRLQLTGSNGKKPFIYLLIAVLTIAIPTIIAQDYLEKSLGTLTHLETINDIDKVPLSKYYELKRFHIDKTNSGVHTAFDVSGRRIRRFNMHQYFVLPILETEADINEATCVAWLGIEYSEQINNTLSEKQKEKAFQAFVIRNQVDFNKRDVNQFIYLERIGNSKQGDGFNEALRNSFKYSGNDPVLFRAVNKSFEDRAGNKFFWMLGAFGIGAAVWLILILIPKFDN